MQWTFDVVLNPETSPVTITNVTNVTVNTGRQALMDNFRATTAEVVCRYPNGYTSPIAGLNPGAQIRITIKELGTGLYSFQVFDGRISDVEVQYGIPYSGGVGNDDYLIITLEGALAELARTNGNDFSMPAGTVFEQVDTGRTTSGVLMTTDAYFFTQNGAATTISGSWADWLNTLAFSFAGRITDWGRAPVLRPYIPAQVVTTQSFSDVAGVNNVQYDQINFDTLAQNYFTQVTVVPPSGVEQIASTGSAPYRNLQINSLSASNGQALDLANLYLNNYNTPALRLASLHVNMNDDSSQYITNLLTHSLGLTNSCLGVARQVNVTFRGTTYPVIIEGAALSASPGECGVTLYVSGADLNAYLVLNDAVFGKLDSNKLGF